MEYLKLISVLLFIFFVIKGFLWLFTVSKRLGMEMTEESHEASNKNYLHCPYFEGEFKEMVMFRRTSFVDHPEAIRYIEKNTGQEIVRYTNNQSYINLSRRYKWVRVYYSDSYIVRVIPTEGK